MGIFDRDDEPRKSGISQTTRRSSARGDDGASDKRAGRATFGKTKWQCYKKARCAQVEPGVWDEE